MTHAAIAVVIAMVTAACGCGSQPVARTTFLRSVDLIDMTDRMAESFANDPVLGRRGRNADPWVISVDRVVNYTNQIIPQREKWLYLARLRAVLAQSVVAERYNIIWVIPPQRWPLVAQELGLDEEPYGLRLPPTHLLTAEFHALTNTSGAGRSDMYLCSFQLLHLSSGTVVWEEKWEVKRAVSGLTYD